MDFSGVSGSMEEDFFTKSQNRNQDVAIAQKHVTVPLTKSVKYIFLLISYSLLSFGSYRSKIESI